MSLKISNQTFFQWLFKNNRVIYLEYSLVALFIIIPLLKWEYIFAIDMVFTPRLRLPTEFAFFPFIFWLLNFIFPTVIIQKIFLFLILLFSGVGMHQLILIKSNWPKYFAGLLYIFNPFIYSRFIYGHIFILLAYALLPFAIKSILIFLEGKRSFKNALKTGFYLALISLASIHNIFFLLLVFSVICLIFILKNISHLKSIKNILKYLLILFVIFFILNSYWLLPFLSKTSFTSQTISFFDKKDIYAFQTATDAKFGPLWNTAAMYGFWGDREQRRYVVQKDIVPYWFELYLVILTLVAWGVGSSVILWVKRKQLSINSKSEILNPKQIQNSKFKIPNSELNGREPWIVLSFVVIGIISLILAVGIAHPWTAPISWWMYNHVPFYKGFREPQKWVALLVLSYAYLGALGVDDLIPRIRGLIGRWQKMLAKYLI